MPYLIDASSFIEAKDRLFCFDICPGFWDWLEQENDAGNVISIRNIYDELMHGDDELKEWARKQGSRLFLPIEEATISMVTNINSWVYSKDKEYTPRAVEQFFKGADSFLIAYAAVHRHIVVTNEVPVSGEKKNVKIPMVCKQFQVEWIHPLEMLRREKVQFVLQPSLREEM